MTLTLGLTPQARSQQVPLLEKRMTIRVTNERMDEVLRQIAGRGGFNFSYSPDIIDVKSRVSINATNQTLREILNVLFDGAVTFKERRRYIILQKAAVVIEKEPESFYVNGYVLDEATGEKLPDASIFEPLTLTSTVSNQYGYYRIKLPAQSEKLQLEVRKEDYARRSLVIGPRKNTYLSITLAPDTLRPLAPPSPRLTTLSDSVRPRVEIPVLVVSKTPDPDSAVPTLPKEKPTLKATLQDIRDGVVYAFSSARQAIHTANIGDTLYRPFQASILPFLGTNHQLSGNVVNGVSLNLIAGYSLGVELLEAGLGINVVRQDVFGVQAAGLANVVGRNVEGLQVGGFANLVVGEFNGVQASGGVNITADNFRGLQVGSGFNIIGGTLYGWQLAPGANIARTVHWGHQIGIVNYADSSATTPFGLLSYVRINGYRRLEFTTDETHYGNVTFKTGVRQFYNIFTIGSSGFINGKPLGSFGYGIGSARDLRRGWQLNADFTANLVAVRPLFRKQSSVRQLRLVVAFEKKLTERLAFSLGPTLNLLSSSYTGLMDGTRPGLEPLWIGGKPHPLQRTYGWVGFQVGLRLCNRTF